MQIIYLPMPVDVDKKRELNKDGYRVVDIAFMPDGYENPIACDDPQGDTQDEPKRRGRKPKDQSE